MNTKAVTSREFAVQVVRTLTDAGHIAYWSGGCVRDQLIGRIPKDYDVATNATPEQVRDIFGHRRTLPIGQSFGVITVLGPKPAAPIEVATFRRESSYSDGRHPDEVAFTDAREDAQRRDFTINGLFYDPLTDALHDFIGGEEDIRRGIVRAIGDPAERIAEDKLRMLRAIRFAATFGFQLESHCLETIRRCASQIHVVSAERITVEMQRMLSHGHRATAVDLLVKSQLLAEILPESPLVFGDEKAQAAVLSSIGQLPEGASFSQAISVLLNDRPGRALGDVVEQLATRWKLANAERREVTDLCVAIPTIVEATKQTWPLAQRALTRTDPHRLIQVARVIAAANQLDPSGVDFCDREAKKPREQWDPVPLLDGNQLSELGIPAGPRVGRLLASLRDAQLLGDVQTAQEARKWIQAKVKSD